MDLWVIAAATALILATYGLYRLAAALRGRP
jgi:hypothetical protein